MKSYILAILPLAGIALAEPVCSQQTVTQTEMTYETSLCSMVTVTETVYATVGGSAMPTTLPDEEDTVVISPSPPPPYSNESMSALPDEDDSAPSEESEDLDDFEDSEDSEEPAAVKPVTLIEPARRVVRQSTNRGEATFYGGNVAGGMCSFTGYTIPAGIWGTALSDSNWLGAGNCGACVSVTGPRGNQLTAMVVDQCPGCGTNHLDLFENAFITLADRSAGIIDVSWNIVPCGIRTPIILKNKEGTSRWWFSMQVMNSNVPVTRLDVSTDGGRTWRPTIRQPYNFFEHQSGFGTESVDVRVTSRGGNTITVRDVSVAAMTTKTAGSNFSS